MLNEPKWDLVFDVLLYLKDNSELDIIEFKKFIDDKIDALKILESHNLDFVKLLVFYIDEKVLNILNTNYSKWSLLQVEYFNINTGGQLFFELIDNNKCSELQKLALLLLKLGFKGRFFENRDRIAGYITSLQAICTNPSLLL